MFCSIPLHLQEDCVASPHNQHLGQRQSSLASHCSSMDSSQAKAMGLTPRMTRSTNMGSRTEQSHGDHQTHAKKSKDLGSIDSHMGIHGRSWRLGMTRSESLPLLLTLAAAFKTVYKQRIENSNTGKWRLSRSHHRRKETK